MLFLYLLKEISKYCLFALLVLTCLNTTGIKEKWNEQKKQFFGAWTTALEQQTEWNEQAIEASFNELAQLNGLKKGDVMLPLRIMLVGGKYGPGVFIIAEMIGKKETIKRIKAVNL